MRKAPENLGEIYALLFTEAPPQIILNILKCTYVPYYMQSHVTMLHFLDVAFILFN